MSEEHKFYGFYRGKVLATDAAETQQLGRIKAEIYPMLIGEETARLLKKSNPDSFVSGIATKQLPWGVPAFPLFCGSGSGTGNFNIPNVGSYCWFFFEAGDINQPVYAFEAPTATLGLPSERITNYPKRRVIATAKGISIVFDDVTGEIIITGDGDVTIQGSTVHINPP